MIKIVAVVEERNSKCGSVEVNLFAVNENILKKTTDVNDDKQLNHLIYNSSSAFINCFILTAPIRYTEHYIAVTDVMKKHIIGLYENSKNPLAISADLIVKR